MTENVRSKAEEREPMLVGLLRLVADECACSEDVGECPEHWPGDPGEWCPVCLVRAALEEEVELPAEPAA